MGLNNMKTGIKVIEAMTKGPRVIEPDASVQDCAKKMKRENVDGILVKIDHRIIGIVTEKDIVDKIAAKNLNAKKTKVRQIMTKKIIGIEPMVDLYDAMIKMRDNDVKRLPVVHNKHLVGMLTEKDIIAIEPNLMDFLVEKFRVKSEEIEPLTKTEYMEGECDNCSNYAQLYPIGDKLICEECRDSLR